ncbi:MAG: nucleotidyl transferase AbiEii/AbiGii toxin family protein, partial [Acidimicrobiia bacterium]|nr:nucleotidyl transferase AbiEii/AbiGii toxin family protein [Acidimicrobiia bacterium]
MGGYSPGVPHRVECCRYPRGVEQRSRSYPGYRSRSEPSILWRGDRAGKRIKAEAAFVSSHDLPVRRWPIRPNHPDIPPAPPIRGYRFVSVIADKLSCISRRVAARDFYDLNSLLTQGEDIHAAWDLYVAIADHPERQYGRRPHPSDIRASYLGRRSAIAADWEESVADSLLPPASFTEAFTNVDNAVQTALGRWKQRLGPGELHRLKQEHQQQPR